MIIYFKNIVNIHKKVGTKLKEKDEENKISKSEKKVTTTKRTKKKEDKETNKKIKAEKIKKVVEKNTKEKPKVTKRTTTKKDIAKKSTTKKKASNKKTITLKKETGKLTKTKKAVKPIPTFAEYYDLPYRYNETVVKTLYQTPNMLFVYWDISDADRENFRKQYGENFFDITYPVLIIHNETMKYSFEVPVNDFANSWYIHINDSKCKYSIELGRKPNYYNQEVIENIKTDYIYVSSSNQIESPNDRVLFSTNENNTIIYKNVKTGEEKVISIYDILKCLPEIKNRENIPYIRENLFKTFYSKIYQNEDITLFESISNPSSSSMSSRFM